MESKTVCVDVVSGARPPSRSVLVCVSAIPVNRALMVIPFTDVDAVGADSNGLPTTALTSAPPGPL